MKILRKMKIIGTGSVLPKMTVTNEMLAQFLDTSDEWITTRTGVRSRHVISDEKLEDMAVGAASKALADAGMEASDLDLIICSNVVNEYITPQLSCIIQGGIGASCPCIYINCACAGFIYALDMADSYSKAGKVRNILIVCAEEPTRMTDWTDRRTCVLFGDGAAAAVLTDGDGIRSIRLAAASATDKLWQYRKLQPTPYITKQEQDVPLQMKGQDMELEPTPENARMILNILRHNGYKKVLLSGIIDDDKQGTATLNGGKIAFQYNTHFNEYIHGAGDCLSSAFIGKLMSGCSFEDAAQKAVDFCHDLIAISLKQKADLRFGLLIERALPLLMK